MSKIYLISHSWISFIYIWWSTSYLTMHISLSHISCAQCSLSQTIAQWQSIVYRTWWGIGNRTRDERDEIIRMKFNPLEREYETVWRLDNGDIFGRIANFFVSLDSFTITMVEKKNANCWMIVFSYLNPHSDFVVNSS